MILDLDTYSYSQISFNALRRRLGLYNWRGNWLKQLPLIKWVRYTRILDPVGEDITEKIDYIQISFNGCNVSL